MGKAEGHEDCSCTHNIDLPGTITRSSDWKEIKRILKRFDPIGVGLKLSDMRAPKYERVAGRLIRMSDTTNNRVAFNLLFREHLVFGDPVTGMKLNEYGRFIREIYV